MLTTTAEDGSEVRAYDEGSGPTILVLHAGMDDGTRWGKVAGQLADRFRVIRLVRRQYRLDLPGPVTIEQEIAHVKAITELADDPVLLVGHSSGGVVALESLLQLRIAGALIYEAALETPPSSWAVPVRDAMAAVDRGQVGRGIHPVYRQLVPRQIYDARAIHQLGDRLDQYSGITTPTTVLTGERSSAYIGKLVAVALRALPHADKVVLPKQGHGANVTGPRVLADAIEAWADRIRSRTVEG
jgi:pimeloyl-ACP methyl ester carboxylesterase